MTCKPSICTMSLGRAFAGHSLEYKLDMAQKYGFRGIELFYEDLEHVAKSLPGPDTTPSASLLTAASQVRRWCDARKLEVICLQPLMHFGALLDRDQQKRALATVPLWCDLARTLGTDLILLPSSFLPAAQLTDDRAVLVQDLRDAADVGLRAADAAGPPIRFAFEALCWGTQICSWEASWDVVVAVDRPNFGLCLDTFNIAGHVFAEPAAPDGRRPGCDAALERSLHRLAARVGGAAGGAADKVFLVQVADAERLERPLVDASHPFYDAAQPARMSWSRNCRLFYGEEGEGQDRRRRRRRGGYLPVRRILQTVLHGLGYRGWLSFEVFHRRLTEEDAAVPEESAARASLSWARLVRDLSLDSPSPSWAHGKERAVL